MIEAINLSFSYNKETKVLKNVNLHIKEGSLISLLGRNGAGKTTLMKLLLGLYKPLEGNVLISGKEAYFEKASEKAKQVAYIPQFGNMAFPSSVEDTILMGMASSISLFSSPSQKDKDKAHGIMKSLGIYDLKNKQLDQISGGEKQMVLIARALCQDAKMLLLDEPTASLDYSNQLIVLDCLKTLSSKGYGLLYSTHNPEQALTTSSSLLLLDNGTSEFYETVDPLLDGERLSGLYGKPLYITKVFTGLNERIICIPK